jgi:SM-20-related protein
MSLLAAAAAGTTLPTTTPLGPGIFAALRSDGFAVVPSWLGRPLVDAVRADALALDAAGLAKPAKLGAAAEVADPTVRLCRVAMLYPPPPNSAGLPATRDALTAAAESLRRELQAGDPERLATTPFHTELQYLLYPAGGLYRRHTDVGWRRGGWRRRGREPIDGGSLSGAEFRRRVSFLLYLNSGWQDRFGGALRLYRSRAPSGNADEPAAMPAARADGLPGRSTDGHAAEPEHVDVVPEAGTLVLFMSARVEHEVLETLRPREAVVGWFRETRGRGHPGYGRVGE